MRHLSVEKKASPRSAMLALGRREQLSVLKKQSVISTKLPYRLDKVDLKALNRYESSLMPLQIIRITRDVLGLHSKISPCRTPGASPMAAWHRHH
jgi:hypothetical protein